MDPARELTELLERRRQLLTGCVDDRSRLVGVGRRARLGEPERDGERDQPLLGAVVEVALEHAASLVGRLDDARARCPDLLVLSPALGDVHAREQHE